MNAKNMDNERISAFADSELDEGDVEAVLAALREPQAKQTWDAYHRIGDMLRSDDMTVPMSTDFSSKVMSRLDDEPVVLAPVARQDGIATKNVKRFLLPGVAAAAAAAVVWVGAPQLLVASKEPAKESPAISVASTASAVMSPSERVASTARIQDDMLRDPGLDEYLLAHQRFSPSLYSTVQYARSATFAADGEK
jgi:sigma-E factor negative regulatory protein RseA